MNIKKRIVAAPRPPTSTFPRFKRLQLQIIAKGAGLIAERIKDIARDNDVPLIEHKPLAQTLFKVVEIGGFIPANLYRAVAEILAYVYGLRAGKSNYV